MMLSFIKMHGLGNDFVILDLRLQGETPSSLFLQKIAERRRGIGCDQVIILTKPSHPTADVLMGIFNADGQEVGACGNATRCVGLLLFLEDQKVHHVIQTKASLLEVTALNHHQGQGHVKVDLGIPQFAWQDIPLRQAADTLHLPLTFEGLKDPVALSVGNPHLIFFVYDVDSIDLEKVGQYFTQHSLFPEGINVEIVEKVDDQTLKMRVFERGVGLTPACGTGACASVVAAVQRGLISRGFSVKVILEGGCLEVIYDDRVFMTGSVHLSFRGVFDPSSLE